jgi:peptidoglycan/xylan/chitin deacetylase (PgdA/CDA1 family)
MTIDTTPYRAGGLARAPVGRRGGNPRGLRRALMPRALTAAACAAVAAGAALDRDDPPPARALPAPPSLRSLAPSPLPRRPAAAAPAAAPSPPSHATRERAAVARVMHRTPFVSSGARRRKTVALTFDDGPSPYTHRLVGELRSRHVPATFFQVGQMVSGFPSAAREVSRHFPVGDHTASHPQLALLPRAAQRAQVTSTIRTLEAVDGGPRPSARRPDLFRPPYASFDRATLHVARRERMLMVLWDVDSADYTLPGTRQIVRNVVSNVRPGSIVLMHDGGGPRSQTLAAVPAIVRTLRRRGYRFVTVPRMMLSAPPRHPQKLPPGAGPGG